MKIRCTSCGDILKLINHPLFDDGRARHVIHLCPNSLNPKFVVEGNKTIMELTAEEIRLILDIISKNHGPGYSKDERIGKLQAKLSILLEVKERSSDW
jgi:hypothetical protein